MQLDVAKFSVKEPLSIPKGIFVDSCSCDWLELQWQAFDFENPIPLFKIIPHLLALLEEKLVGSDAFAGVVYQEPSSVGNEDLGYFEIERYFAVRLCKVSRTLMGIMVESDRTIFSPHYCLINQRAVGLPQEFIHLDSPNYSEITSADLEERYGADMVEYLQSYERFIPSSHQGLEVGCLPLNPC